MAFCRILVVSHKYLPDYAGWLQQTLTMIRACDPERVSFTWICPGPNEQPSTEEWPLLSVKRIGATLLGAGRLSRIAFGASAARYLVLNQRTYDLVYCPQSYTPTDIISLVARHIGKPVVVREAIGELSDSTAQGRLRCWMLARNAAAIIVLNQQRSIQLGSVTNKVHLFPNGVDIARFHPDKTKARYIARSLWKGHDAQQVVLFVGGIVARKGVDTLVKAFIQIAENSPDSVLVLTGPTEIRDAETSELRLTLIESLRALVRKSGLESRVHFLGSVSSVPEIMRAADIFVLPSVSEGMPNALLEAMSTGLPCIATNIPGTSDLIEHGCNGLLFPVGDTDKLAAHLRFLLSDPAQRNELGSMARSSIERRFSIREMAAQYQDMFIRLSTDCV